MDTWEEARIKRLEGRVDRLEQKEWERRDRIFRAIANAFLIVMVVLYAVAITLAIAHPAH